MRSWIREGRLARDRQQGQASRRERDLPGAVVWPHQQGPWTAVLGSPALLCVPLTLPVPLHTLSLWDGLS